MKAPAVVCWAPDGLLDPKQPLISRQGIDELAQLIPDALVLPIDGTNHYTILLRPQAVDQVIDAIVAEPRIASTSS